MGYLKLEALNISDSSLALLDSCPRKFEFRKLFVSDRNENTMALSTGTAMHEGTQSYVAGSTKDRAIFNMLLKTNLEYQVSDSVQNSWQACVHTLDIAMQYWDKDMADWEIATIKDAEGHDIPAVEVPFTLKTKIPNFYPNGDDLPVNYVCYVDLILYNRIEDRYAVVDIKTTTKDTDKTVDFTFANQCLPYGLALEVLLGKDYRQGFEIIYWVEYIHPTKAHCQLYHFMKTQEDVQDWVLGLMLHLEAIKDYYNRQWWPRKSSGCKAWNRTCKFFDICQSRDIDTLKAFVLMENATFAAREPRKQPWLIIDLGITS